MSILNMVSRGVQAANSAAATTGLLGAGTALGTSLISGLFGQGSNRKAYHRSKKLMYLQRDLDKEMWDYQNAYNTPAQQMARFKDAGLNPALMYGQGTPGNANSHVQSKFQELRPHMGPTDIAQTTAAGVQMSLANAQRKQIEENTMYTKIKGANETKNYQYQNALAAQQARKLREETLTEVQNRALLIAQEDKVKAEKANIDLLAAINREDANWLKDNKTSKYEHGIIRAIKSVLGDTKKALDFFLENRFMFEEPPMQEEYRYNSRTGRFHRNY